MISYNKATKLLKHYNKLKLKNKLNKINKLILKY